MNEVGLMAVFGYPDCVNYTRVPYHKEAVHGACSHVRGPATGISLRLHRAQLRDLPGSDDRLVPVPTPPLRHRANLVQWLGPRRPPQLLPSLLQSGVLGSRSPLARPGPHLADHLRAQRSGGTGRRRYLVPQTRPDHLRHRHAPRSADLQPRHEAGPLGARLGPVVPSGPLLLGAQQGLVFSAVAPALSHPPWTPQGSQGQATSPPSHPSPPSRISPPLPPPP